MDHVLEDRAIRNLYVQVVYRAFLDACEPVRNNGKYNTAVIRPTTQDQRIARFWLLADDTGDFEFVTQAAGFDPEVVRKTAIRMKNKKWSNKIILTAKELCKRNQLLNL